MTARTAAVIGGGISGLASARALALDGYAVTVYDVPRAGSPSPVAAGMLAPACELEYGESGLHQLLSSSLARWSSLATELGAETGVDVGLRTEGTLLLSTHPDDDARLTRREALIRSHAGATRRLTPSECRDAEPSLSPAIRGALHVSGDLSVDNRQVLLALRKSLRLNGSRFLRRNVTIEVDGSRAVGVRSSTGVHDADLVVLAAGVSSRSLAARIGLNVPVRPVKGELLRLKSSAALLRHTIRARVDEVDVYLVPRHDGSIVVGATSEDVGGDIRRTPRAVLDLLTAATAILPELRDAELVEHCVGVRPGTPDNGPFLGPCEIGGLLLATGHYRHGFLLAPMTADVISASAAATELPTAATAFTLARFSDLPTRRHTA